MMQDKGLLEVIHQLVKDGDFRQRFMMMPREVLMSELGISREAYDTLLALVPILLAGGMFVLGDAMGPGDPPAADPTGVEWGRRG